MKLTGTGCRVTRGAGPRGPARTRASAFREYACAIVTGFGSWELRFIDVRALGSGSAAGVFLP